MCIRDRFDAPQDIDLAIANPWFTGSAKISTFSREELLATKLRALLQRDKGRDLLDLAHALKVFPELNRKRIVECLGLYLGRSGLAISRAEAEQRMFAKLVAPRFVTDIRPLLAADVAANLTTEAVRDAFISVFGKLITLLPGAAWAKTPEKIESFGLALDGD